MLLNLNGLYCTNNIACASVCQNEQFAEPLQSNVGLFDYYRYNTSDSSSQREVIKRNFLNVDVVSSAFDATFLVERPKFADMDFVSEFAAALNLWAGISMAVFIEVIEVLIRVFLDWCKLARN